MLALAAGTANAAEPETGAAAAVEKPAAPTASDIVVTAAKRVQNVQDVPIAATAVSEAKLQSLNITNTAALAVAAPGIVFVPAPNPNNLQFVVRGIGTYSTVDTLEQSVGVAIDGIPLGRIAGAVVDAVDVARVEVLRGPQGTLFGKSATAGLVSVVNNKPVFNEFQAIGRVYYGENQELRVQGTLNVPLADRLALRVSAWDFSRDGYIRAPLQSDGNIGDFHNAGVRGRLAAQITDSWRVDLSAEYSNNRNDGVQQTARAYMPNDFVALPGAPTVAQLNASMGIVPGPNNLAVGSEVPIGGFVKPQFYHLESNWDMGDVTLTSVTGYREIDSSQVSEYDYSGSRSGSFTTYLHYKSNTDQFTTELRLANSSKNKFRYTFGLFYYNLDVNNSSFEQTARNVPSLPAPYYATGRFPNSTMNTKNYAAFADLNYDLGPLTLIAGARLSHEKSRGTFERGLPRDGAPAEGGPDTSIFLPGSAVAGYTPLSVASSVKYDDFSWRAGAQYHVAPDIMIYATASRAYKGPGFNFAADLTPAVFAQTRSIVDPEIAHSYEVGLRTQFFDRQVTFNVTGYYAPYKDFQITAALPGTGGNGLTYTIINAGGIHAKGIETEFAFNPRGALSGFSINGDLTWNDTKYSDFTNAPCYALQPRSATPSTMPGVCAAPSVGSTASVQSVNGFRTVGNPEWKINGFIAYDTAVTPALNAFAQGHLYYQSATQYGVGVNPATRAPGYKTVDLTLGIRAADNQWKLSVIGKNIFDKRYVTRIVTNNPGLMQVVPYEALSSWGVALDVRF